MKWSAQHLADEMTKVGVPWNRHIVVNLEQGRRKSLRVHELLALAYVLGVASPLDVLVPASDGVYPVTPATLLAADAVRAWFLGETGSLREWTAGTPQERDQLREMLAGSGITEPQLESVLRLALSINRRPDDQAAGSSNGAR
jgi:hypothetical protein